MLTRPVSDPTVHTVALDPLGALAFVVAFALVVALTRVRPAFGIAALVVAVPFALARDVGFTTITLGKIALFATIVGLALRRTELSSLRAPAARAILIAAALVVVATALSIAQAHDRAPAVRETLKAIEYLALFATVVVAARADIALRGVASALCATTIAVGVLALLEELFGARSGMFFYDRPIPRIAGPLEGPNQLAGYLGIALCFALATTALRRGSPFAGAALVLGVAAEILTISRAGLVALVVGLGTVLTFAPRRPTKGIYLAIGASVILGFAILAAWGFGASHTLGGALALAGYFATVGESSHAGSVGTRSQLWQAAYTLWHAHPILGIGAGNFEGELGLAGFPTLHTHANSLYVQALVEGGIPLLLATVALVVASIAVFVRGPFGDPFVLASLGASVGFALHQSADLLVFFPKVGELWWILIALGTARRDADRAFES